MEVFDNINNRLFDSLKKEIKPTNRIPIAANTFSIYAFEHLRKELEKIDELRFIFTSPSFIADKLKKESREFYIPNIHNERDLCGGEFEIRLKNSLNQKSIAKECAQWIRTKGKFKSNNNSNAFIQGQINIENNNENITYMPINGFTSVDIGSSPSNGYNYVTTKIDYPNSKAFLNLFNQYWDDSSALNDVTNEVLSYFESAYKENSPEFIYYISLYNIFNEFLLDISDTMPNQDIRLKDSLIWNKLYNFQMDAVIGVINKLEKYNGCILADSVGLGKTFSALAVIKYYEKRNKDVLVLCPKKLEANWNTYRYNDVNNIFAKDQFRYDVLFHTDLSRERGYSNGRDLEKVNWGNYDLLVIDESHNFRNNNQYAGRLNRYQKLINNVINSGVKTKVLMLSATPVNNRFNDLKNQLALAYGGDSNVINEILETNKGIDEIFKNAQTVFNNWSKLPNDRRTTENILNQLDIDFFTVLDSLTIARSRKHITKYYDTSSLGKFPTRNKPINKNISISKDLNDGDISFHSIADSLIMLNLSLYTPLNYVLPHKVAYYEEKYSQKTKVGIFRQQDRDQSLKTLMRINLLKRIESSIYSFVLTLEDVLKKIESNLHKIESNNAIITSQIKEDFFENSDVDYEDGEDEEIMVGGKIEVKMSDIDKIKWKEDLNSDKENINLILSQIKEIYHKKDDKLEELKSIISNKVENPINPNNKKIIVFTAFADTANYLYEKLHKWIKNEYNINTALITGSSKKTNCKSIKTDINTILTCFSPISKEKNLILPNIEDSIDLLIATDCISEGQNLQDCDFLINYDIHWNPVRIIQRFGRIDRIGSLNDSISMVNFWPDIQLDEYINLKRKVESKMIITNMTSTGDDNILNENEKDLDYRKAQLEKLKEDVIDLEDVKEGISITDLGLTDFRVDLSNLVKKYGELKNIPKGLHSVVKGDENLDKGVIFILRNINNEIDKNKQNRLHPYYILYLKDNGDIVFNHLQSKKTLDLLRGLCNGKTEPIAELCNEFNKETNDCKKMDKYSELVELAIKSILNKEEDSVIDSLFKAGGTSSCKSTKGMEDFTLISFLIVY